MLAEAVPPRTQPCTTSPAASPGGGTSDDPVEAAVQEVWARCPGAGVRQLVTELARLFPRLAADGPAFKRRVKAAKEALPYVRARDLPGAPACFMHAAAVRVLNEISSD
jgi:transposase InsO family protein